MRLAESKKLSVLRPMEEARLLTGLFEASRGFSGAGEVPFANIAPATYKEGMSLPRKSKMKSPNQSTSGELGHSVSPAGAWVRLKTFY